MSTDDRVFRIIAAGIFIRLILSGYITDELFSYSIRGGFPILKIHPGSYLLMATFAALAFAKGAIPFTLARARAEPWVFQFFLITFLVALYELMRFGMSGLAYMVDALIIPPLALLLLHFASPQQRLSLAKLIINFIFFNSLMAIAEFVLKTHFLPAGPLEGADYFRSTAILGHPLANALMTAPLLPLLFLLNWSINRKLLYMTVYIVSILAYGARGAFAIGLTVFAAGMLLSGGALVRRRNLRATTFLIIIFIALLIGAGAIGVLLFGTDFGARIVQRAYLDDSAETRILIFRIFDVLTSDQIWQGLPLWRIEILQQKYDFFKYLENFWVIMLIGMGLPAFCLFAASFLLFIYGLQKSQHMLIRFAALSFILVASTNNSLSTKTPALLMFSLAAYGLRRQSGRTAAQSVSHQNQTVLLGQI
jgi:hypothetical protein